MIFNPAWCFRRKSVVQYFIFDQTSRETTNQSTTHVFNHEEIFNPWLNTVQTNTSELKMYPVLFLNCLHLPNNAKMTDYVKEMIL